jgi:hypothetical protein
LATVALYSLDEFHREPEIIDRNRFGDLETDLPGG